MNCWQGRMLNTTTTLIALLLCSSLASWAWGAETTGPAIVTAKEFQVLDDQGQPRAILGVREGTAGLFLISKRGQIRVDVGLLSDDSPALVFTDANGLVRVKLVDVAGEMPALALHDKEGRTRLILSLFPDGRATVMLLAADGTMQAQLWIADDGLPRLDFASTPPTDDLTCRISSDEREGPEDAGSRRKSRHD